MSDKMLFGFCAGPEYGSIMKDAGYDFIELNVQGHLKPEEDEKAFTPVLQAIKSCGIRCLAANCFIPGGMKVTGPDVDFGKIEKYVATACRRAAEAGIKIIVFGSGGARKIPDGFDRKAAYAQLLEFGRISGREAAKNRLTIVVEPLNRNETNVFNTTAESAKYVRELDHPNVKLLVDSFHWCLEGDTEKDIADAADIICHAHISTYKKRLVPGAEPCDYSGFLGALRKSGFRGGLAIEGGWLLEGDQISWSLDAAGVRNNPQPLAKALSLIRK